MRWLESTTKVLHHKWSRLVINPKDDDSALFKKENAKSLKRGIIFVDGDFHFFFSGHSFLKYVRIIYLMAIGI